MEWYWHDIQLSLFGIEQNRIINQVRPQIIFVAILKVKNVRQIMVAAMAPVKFQDIPNGYPKLGAFISKDQDWVIFRKFKGVKYKKPTLFARGAIGPRSAIRKRWLHTEEGRWGITEVLVQILFVWPATCIDTKHKECIGKYSMFRFVDIKPVISTT
jgi:hypothetical protein